MGFEAKIHADSTAPSGVRLTTFEITFPRPFLAEFNTHRVFSRNSASSRAIPVEKMIERVMVDPYIPTSWGKNQKGMQANEDVSAAEAHHARTYWLRARDEAINRAQQLLNIGIHKQLTNRLLEPFLWHTAIVTATEWSNFFHLRNNAMAQPEIQIIARMMQQLYESNEPKKLDYGQWHLPLVEREEMDAWVRDGLPTDNPDIQPELMARLMQKYNYWVAVSVGRCARVSYLTHDGKRDPAADIELHDDLLKNGHMSPFEHVARPADPNSEADIKLARFEHAHTDIPNAVNFKGYYGNLHGWVQYRKMIPHEHDILGTPKHYGAV